MAAHVPQQKIDDCRELYVKFGGGDHDRIVAEMRARDWSGFTKRNLYARTRGGRVTPGWPERFGWDGELFTAETLRREGEKAYRRRSRHLRRSGRLRAARLLAARPQCCAERLCLSDSCPYCLRGSASAGGTAPNLFNESAEKAQPFRTSRGHSPGNSHRKSKPGIAYASRGTFAREHTPFPKAAMLIPEPPKFNRQKMRRLRKDERHSAGNAGALACTDAASASGGVSVISNSNGTKTPPAGGTGGTGGGTCAPGNNAPPDFHSWLKTLPGAWGWDYLHQLYLYSRLKRVTDGTCKRLMIFMPPRHGKSEMVTVRYAAWRLKQDPSMNIILGSYNQSLANKFSRKIKRVLCDDALCGSAAVMCGKAQPFRQPVKGVLAAQPPAVAGRARRQKDNDDGKAQPFHTSLAHSPEETNGSPFPFTKPRPINTMSEWETTEGGGLRAVGVGSGVTGYGASLIVIDDPVKSREQANSERFREKVWDWFNDDLYTRLEPGGAIILIQTRWHQDDLAGRLLIEMANGGQQWEIVALPALAEAGNAGEGACAPGKEGFCVPRDPLGRLPGEPLWPDRFGVDELEEQRQRMTDVSFAALYQQRPVPAEGGVFKRAWFKQIVDHPPKGLKWKRGYDLAISIKQTADYTASFRVAFDSEGYLYIDGGFRRRIDFPQQRRYIIERMTLERDTEHGVEEAIHGRSVMQELRKLPNLRGRQFRGVPIKGDKHERALPWIRLAEEGRIRLTRGTWNKPFIEEACSFPHGTHDDQVDAVSLAVSMHEHKPSKLYVF